MLIHLYIHTGENFYKNRKSADSEVAQTSTDLSDQLEFVCRYLVTSSNTSTAYSSTSQ